jgi:hypothetical protein
LRKIKENYNFMRGGAVKKLCCRWWNGNIVKNSSHDEAKKRNFHREARRRKEYEEENVKPSHTWITYFIYANTNFSSSLNVSSQKKGNFVVDVCWMLGGFRQNFRQFLRSLRMCFDVGLVFDYILQQTSSKAGHCALYSVLK